MKISHKSRYSAAGVHFLSSLFIFSLLLWIIIKIWYPQPFFSSSGGWQGLKIVALIDLVLGPLITLIIYNSTKSKKELMTDVGTIIILQLAVLSFGIHTIYSERPVAITFWESEFYSIPASALNKQGIGIEQLNQFSDQFPALIYAKKPKTKDGLEEMVKIVEEKNTPPTQQFFLYESATHHISEILQHSININKIISANKDMAKKLESILKETKTKQEDNYYLPLKSRYQNIILIFNSKLKQIGYIKAPYFS